MTRWIVSRLILVFIGVCIPVVGAKLLQEAFGTASDRQSPASHSPNAADANVRR